MINKTERFYLILAAVLWCGLTALFTYGDLEFSMSLVHEEAGWAIWLERLGEFPGVLTAWLASAILMARGIQAERRGGGQTWCLVLGLLALLCFSLYIPNRYSYYFWDSRGIRFSEWLIVFTITAFVVWGILRVMEEAEEEECREAAKRAAFALLVFAVIMVAVHIMKGIWGRVRFRDMNGSYELYTPWFIIVRGSSGTSFPSGHTASAAMTALLIFVLPVSSRWTRNLLALASVLYTLAVAYSRVIVGAHFFTDTLFALGITYGGILAASAIFRVYNKRKALTDGKNRIIIKKVYNK